LIKKVDILYSFRIFCYNFLNKFKIFSYILKRVYVSETFLLINSTKLFHQLTFAKLVSIPWGSKLIPDYPKLWLD
jgi:hypothetical protein